MLISLKRATLGKCKRRIVYFSSQKVSSCFCCWSTVFQCIYYQCFYFHIFIFVLGDVCVGFFFACHVCLSVCLVIGIESFALEKCARIDFVELYGVMLIESHTNKYTRLLNWYLCIRAVMPYLLKHNFF